MIRQLSGKKKKKEQRATASASDDSAHSGSDERKATRAASEAARGKGLKQMKALTGKMKAAAARRDTAAEATMVISGPILADDAPLPPGAIPLGRFVSPSLSQSQAQAHSIYPEHPDRDRDRPRPSAPAERGTDRNSSSYPLQVTPAAYRRGTDRGGADRRSDVDGEQKHYDSEADYATDSSVDHAPQFSTKSTIADHVQNMRTNPKGRPKRVSSVPPTRRVSAYVDSDNESDLVDDDTGQNARGQELQRKPGRRTIASDSDNDSMPPKGPARSQSASRAGTANTAAQMKTGGNLQRDPPTQSQRPQRKRMSFSDSSDDSELQSTHSASNNLNKKQQSQSNPQKRSASTSRTRRPPSAMRANNTNHPLSPARNRTSPTRAKNQYNSEDDDGDYSDVGSPVSPGVTATPLSEVAESASRAKQPATRNAVNNGSDVDYDVDETYEDVKKQQSRDASASRKKAPQKQQQRGAERDSSEGEGGKPERPPPTQQQVQRRGGPDDVSKERVIKMRQQLRVSTQRKEDSAGQSSEDEPGLRSMAPPLNVKQQPTTSNRRPPPSQYQESNTNSIVSRAPTSPGGPLPSRSASQSPARGVGAPPPRRPSSQSPHRNLRRSATTGASPRGNGSRPVPRAAAATTASVVLFDTDGDNTDKDEPTSPSPPRKMAALDPSKRAWAAAKGHHKEPTPPSALDRLEGKVAAPASAVGVGSGGGGDRKSLQRRSSDLELWNMEAMLADKKAQAEKQRAQALAKAEALAKAQVEAEEREYEEADARQRERQQKRDEELREREREKEREREREREKERERDKRERERREREREDEERDLREIEEQRQREGERVREQERQDAEALAAALRSAPSPPSSRDSSPVRHRPPPRSVSLSSSEQLAAAIRRKSPQPAAAKQAMRPPRGPESTSHRMPEQNPKSPDAILSPPPRVGRGTERKHNPRLSSLSMASSQRSSMISIPERRSSMLSMANSDKRQSVVSVSIPSPPPPQPAALPTGVKKFNWATAGSAKKGAAPAASDSPVPLPADMEPMDLSSPKAHFPPMPAPVVPIMQDSDMSEFEDQSGEPGDLTESEQEDDGPTSPRPALPPRQDSKASAVAVRPPRSESKPSNVVTKGGSSGKKRRAPPPRKGSLPTSDMPQGEPKSPNGPVLSPREVSQKTSKGAIQVVSSKNAPTADEALDTALTPASTVPPPIPEKDNISIKSPLAHSKPAVKVADMWAALEQETQSLEVSAFQQKPVASPQGQRHDAGESFKNMFDDLEREASTILLPDSPTSGKSGKLKASPSAGSFGNKKSMKPWKASATLDEDIWKMLEEETLLLKDVLAKPSAPITEEDRIRRMEERALRKLASLEQKCLELKERVRVIDDDLEKRETEGKENAKGAKAAEKPSLLASLFKSTPKEKEPPPVVAATITKQERSASSASQQDFAGAGTSLKRSGSGRSIKSSTTVSDVNQNDGGSPQPSGSTLEDVGSASPVQKSGFLNRIWKGRQNSNAHQTDAAADAVTAAVANVANSSNVESLPTTGSADVTRKGSNASSAAVAPSPILKNSAMKTATVEKPSGLKESSVPVKAATTGQPVTKTTVLSAATASSAPGAAVSKSTETGSPPVKSLAAKQSVGSLPKATTTTAFTVDTENDRGKEKKPDAIPSQDSAAGTAVAPTGEKKTVLGWLFGKKGDNQGATPASKDGAGAASSSDADIPATAVSGPVAMATQPSSDGESVSSSKAGGMTAAERSAERRKKWAELKKETDERGASPVTWTRKQSDDEGSDSNSAAARVANRRASALRKRSDAGIAEGVSRARSDTPVGEAGRSPSRRRAAAGRE
ncbi:hypothetical protein BC830DRAFT_1181804 [Chytriomyces sp. MP71]|nr:hypothetical protein BC830DRAFT_1181804 [Chytriomyces sp. MP71]